MPDLHSFLKMSQRNKRRGELILASVNLEQFWESFFLLQMCQCFLPEELKLRKHTNISIRISSSSAKEAPISSIQTSIIIQLLPEVCNLKCMNHTARKGIAWRKAVKFVWEYRFSLDCLKFSLHVLYAWTGFLFPNLWSFAIVCFSFLLWE